MTGVQRVRDALVRAFPGDLVEVRDFSGQTDHVEARIVSPTFEGKSLIERHRLVYAALGDAFAGPVHALSFRALTPSEAKEG